MMDVTLRRNLLINLTGLALPTLVSLVTVPLYIKVLGVDRFGVMTLVWVLVGYFTLCDFGISLAGEKRIARALATADHADIALTFWSALWTNLVTGLIGAVILWAVAGAYFHWATHAPEALLNEVTQALPWIALSIPVGNVALVFAGAISAAERFSVFNINQTIGTVLFQVLPVTAAFVFAPTLQVALCTAVFARAVSALMLGVAAVRVLEIDTVQRAQRACVRALFRYGRWLQLTVAANMIGESLDRVVVGALQPPRFVTYYAVPQNLVSRLNLLSGALSRTLFPRLAAARREEAVEIAHHALGFLQTLLTPVTIGALFVLEPFLRSWVGQELSSSSGEIGRIMILGVWLGGQTTVARNLMLAQGKEAGVAHVSLLLLPAFALLLWGGVYLFGIQGAVMAVLVRGVAEYAALLRLCGMRARPLVHEMAPHLVFVALALLLASHVDGWLPCLAAGTALALCNMGWSLHSSATFRDVAKSAWRRVSPRPTPDDAAPDVAASANHEGKT